MTRAQANTVVAARHHAPTQITHSGAPPTAVRTAMPSAQIGGYLRSGADQRPSLSVIRSPAPRATGRLFTSPEGGRHCGIEHRSARSGRPSALARAGGVVRHRPRLVPVRIACDRERSGSYWGARRGHRDAAVPGRRSLCRARAAAVLWPDEHPESRAVIHRLVSVRDLVEGDLAVEHLPGFDGAVEDVPGAGSRCRRGRVRVRRCG